MSPQKEALATGGNQPEGEDRDTREGDLIMNQNMTTPTHIATDVAEALAAIDNIGRGCVEFVPGEPLYQEPVGTFVVSADQVHRVDVFGVAHLMRLIDRDGRDVDCSADYWAEHSRHTDPTDVRSWRRGINGGIRLGDLLAVSYGDYEIAREFEIEGVRMVELGIAA